MAHRPAPSAATGPANLVRKVRRNIHWGRTHGWANLLEEHDWNPTVRVRRLVDAWSWRLANGPVGDTATTFIVGAQRSGTNMMVYGLGNTPEVRMYNEGDRQAYSAFALRSDDDVRRLVDACHYPHVVFKPLLDSHRVVDLLDLSGLPGPTRAVWAYRDVDGRVRSYLAKFGDINLRVMAAYARTGDASHWQLQGMGENSARFVRSLDYDGMSPASGAALFWYVRNQLFFDLDLHDRPDVCLASYNDFIARPEQSMADLCAFLDIPFREAMVAHIESRPQAVTRALDIDPRIRARCQDLAVRLDDAKQAQSATG